MRSSRSRSAKLAAALVTGAALLASPAGAAPLRRVAVQVDLQGVGAIAGHIRQTLPRQLAGELARNPVEGYPPGARLVVRVTEIFLANEPGVRGGRFGGGMAMPDAIEGEALVLDAGGAIIARKPVSGRSPVSSGGALPSPYSEPRRVEALTGNFAYWIVRGLN
ncbi:MAG: hypothetical protein FD175_774 [Beijerinckiaceae bacterium]|nr:MAG: hypothetical protein FD175_774 [Beijerinckiaceae bacterium]